MSLWVVCATGPSLSAADVEYVKGKAKVVAVSDAYRLCPWADVIASSDAAWWEVHKDAISLHGEKIGAMPVFQLIKGVGSLAGHVGINSGLLGIRAAVSKGATKVVLLGFDMHSPGDHFFGRHPESLKSTTPERMKVFHKQFDAYHPAGVDIVNCTKGSELKAYRMGDIREEVL
jgi:hypothetical protein